MATDGKRCVCSVDPLYMFLCVRGRKPGEIRRPTALNQRTSPRNFANLAKTGVFRRRFASQRSPVRARLAPLK